MASVFWDAHGILFIDYLEKGKTINSDYYIALLDRLSAEIKKKRPHMVKKKVLFYQENAPCHKSIETMVKLNELSFEWLPFLLYSPDLASSDYWIFADLKKMLQRKRFGVIKGKSAFSACAIKKTNYYEFQLPSASDPRSETDAVSHTLSLQVGVKRVG